MQISSPLRRDNANSNIRRLLSGEIIVEEVEENKKAHSNRNLINRSNGVMLLSKDLVLEYNSGSNSSESGRNSSQYDFEQSHEAF